MLGLSQSSLVQASFGESSAEAKQYSVLTTPPASRLAHTRQVSAQLECWLGQNALAGPLDSIHPGKPEVYVGI